MRQGVISFGFVVVGVLAGAVSCAGADEPDQTDVSPSTSGTGSSTGTTSTAASSSTSSASSSSAASSSTGAISTAATTTSAEPAGPSFATDIHPIFTAKCSGGALCHGDGEAMAKYASATVATAWGLAKTDMTKLTNRVLTGQMPVDMSLQAMCQKDGVPDRASTNPGCLTGEELDKLQAWIDAGGPE